MSYVQTKPTILLVDDDNLLRETLCDILELENYEVIEAENGFDGLEKFMKHCQTICGVITDLRMPKMNGAELIREIREVNKMIPVFIISGEEGVINASELVEKMNAKFIRKPFNFYTELLGDLKCAVTQPRKAVA